MNGNKSDTKTTDRKTTVEMNLFIFAMQNRINIDERSYVR